MAITKEQIFAVADKLDAADQNPTLASVRKQLGGGSFTTIWGRLRKRKIKHAKPVAAVAMA